MAEITPIQFYRGTAAAVASANPVLAAGKPFFETDTGVFKIGDGVTAYNSLASVGSAGSGDDKLDSLITIASHTGNYTVASADLIILTAGGTLDIVGNDTGDLTIPLNSSVAITVGKWFTARGYGNVVATGGVTVTGTRGDLTVPSGATVGLQKTGTDTWILHNGTAGGGGGGSGTVNSGSQYRLGYYATAGTAISNASAITAAKALKSDANGVPTHFDTATEPSLTELTYVKGVTSPIQTQLGGKSDHLITHVSKTASYTLLSADLDLINAGDVVHYLFDSASGTNLTIPPNSDVAFPVGAVIFVTFINTGITSFVAGSGVTLTNADGLVLSTRYKRAFAEKIGTNQWLLGGALTT